MFTFPLDELMVTLYAQFRNRQNKNTKDECRCVKCLFCRRLRDNCSWGWEVGRECRVTLSSPVLNAEWRAALPQGTAHPHPGVAAQCWCAQLGVAWWCCCSQNFLWITSARTCGLLGILLSVDIVLLDVVTWWYPFHIRSLFHVARFNYFDKQRLSIVSCFFVPWGLMRRLAENWPKMQTFERFLFFPCMILLTAFQ